MKYWLAGLCTMIVAGVLAAGLALSAHALDVPSAPPLDRPIIDQTKTLTSQEIDQLTQQIAAERAKKDFQLGILFIQSLEGQSLEEYSLDVARRWGIGSKESSSGVLLLIAKDDRKLRIEVGNGQEGDLTDARASRIIRNIITPEFRNGNYYQGISSGVTEIASAIQRQPEAAESASMQSADWGAIAFFGLIVVSWLASILGRTKSWWAGGVIGCVMGGALMFVFGTVVWTIGLAIFLTFGGFLLDFLVSRNYQTHSSSGDSPSWWAGGPWIGGSGGSGGGSFGGGGFSGGGSSGSW